MAQYERLEAGARTPWDAVVVTVREVSGRTVADVAAVEHVADFPKPVALALADAAALQEKMGLNRTVVILSEEKLWKSEWGNLVNPSRA